jgi:hypothetical protein
MFLWIPAVVLMFLIPPQYAIAQSWKWAINAPGARSLAADPHGNLFTLGIFIGPSVKLGKVTFMNAGGKDILVTKRDQAGNVIWAYSFGGIYDETETGIASDISGNAYITGHFNSPTLTFGNTVLVNQGSTDIFIVKFDPSGNILWARSGGGTSNDECRAIAVDVKGNVMVTGYFYEPSIRFGPVELTSSGLFDAFIVRYDASGIVIWARLVGGTLSEFARDVTTDASGHVYITGDLTSQTLTIGTATFSSQGSGDIFIVKYDATGNLLWARTAGSPGYDWSISIAIDKMQNIYVAGDFSHDSLQFSTGVVYNTGLYDVFLIKYDRDGNLRWLRAHGGQGNDELSKIRTDPHGNIYMCGGYQSPFSFGTYHLLNSGNYDFFIAKYDSSGNPLWAITAGGSGREFPGDFIKVPSGSLYVSCYTNSPSVVFGHISASLPNNKGFYLVKLHDGTDTPVLPPQEHTITFFPNPFSSHATLTTGEWFSNTSLTVYNVRGQVVRKLTGLQGNKITVSREELATGLYFYKLEKDHGEIVSGKFIIIP